MQPVYQPADIAFDTTLLGSWGDSTSREGATVTRDGDQYLIKFTDSRGKQAGFVGRLFRLGGHPVMDVTPDRLPDSLARGLPDEYWSLLLGGHTLFWIEHTSRRLAFVSLNADTLRRYLRQHPTAVPHFFIDSQAVLTASPRQLQAFVTAFRQRAHALGDSTIWFRRGN